MSAAGRNIKTTVSLTVLLVLLGRGAPAGGDVEFRLVQRSGDADEENSSAKKSPVEGYHLQQFGQPLPLFKPRQPMSEEEKAASEAMAWYMTGELRQARSDLRGALEAYRKAVERDPNAVAIYQALVPLAFKLEKSELAVDYALKAVEVDPDNFQLLRKLGIYMAKQRKLPEAIRFLEQASNSSRIEEKSGIYAALMRDLALLYTATDQAKKAADCYTVVLDALQHPGQYALNRRTRKAILQDASETYQKMGRAFLQAGQPEKALQAFQLAVKNHRGNPGHLSFNLAQVYAHQKQFREARQELQKYFDAELQSKGPAAYELLAEILEGLGKSDQLIPQLEDLAESDPHNATLMYFLAKQYRKADRHEKAVQLYKKALKESGDPQGYLGLAAVYREQNRPADLLKALSNATQDGQEPERIQAEVKAILGNKKLLKDLLAYGRKHAGADENPLDFPSSYILGRIALEAEKIDAAVTFYRAALELAQDKSAALYQELGQFLMEKEAYGQAAGIYREAADDPGLVPIRPNFLYRLSQARELNGETEKALEAIRQARQIAPKSRLTPRLHYQEGWIHYHSRQWDQAVKLFKQVVSKYPEEEEVVRRCRFSLSNIYVQQGEVRKGEKILEKVLEENPDDPSVNNDLGYLYADQGKNLQKAELMIRKAVQAEPNNPAYLDSLGWVLYQQGKYQEALQHLKNAVSQPGGEDPTILDHLGDCYEKLEQSEQARQTWQKALQQAKQQAYPNQEVVDGLKKKLKTDAGKGQ